MNGQRTLPAFDGSRLYERHAVAADRGAWSVERDVEWRAIDPELAHTTPAVLDQLREAAVIESYHPVHLGRLMLAHWDDLDAGVVFSLEAYEGFKHFQALRRYLEVVDHRPALTDEALLDARRRARLEERPPHSALEQLVDFMLSEHLASYFFRRLAEQAVEPVLVQLLELIARDEVRHAQSASDLIARRVRREPALARTVLQAAAGFRHYGEEVAGSVPVALAGDAVAIRTFARRIERITGSRLVDHLKEEL